MVRNWKSEEKRIERLTRTVTEKLKRALFDLYDRCGQPIMRVLKVDYVIDTTGKFGDYIHVLLRGESFNSSHLRAIREAVVISTEGKFGSDVSFRVSYDTREEREKLIIEVSIG